MLRIGILSALLLVATSAFAQQKNPVEQKLGSQIGALVIQNAALQAQVEQLQAQLTAERKSSAAKSAPQSEPKK